MNKKELIKQIFENSPYRYIDVEYIVNEVFENIESTLEKGEKVSISGFGTFDVAHQNSYMGVHPITGEAIEVKGFNKIRFNCGTDLKKRINK